MPLQHDSLRSLLPSVHAEAAFADAVVWARGETVQVGAGGWTVLLNGRNRLRRLSELWSRSVKATPQTGTLAMIPVPAAEADEPRPRPGQRAWVAGTFADDSPEPAVLRIPTHWTELTPEGVTLYVQEVSATALRAAVAVDEAAELAPHGRMPLPAADPDAAWDDAGYADGVRAVLERLGKPAEGPEATGEILRKVVISRTETVPADEDALWAALDALREAYPQTWVFAVGGLLGATPEMLATRHDGSVESLVLAGSVPRGANAQVDEAAKAHLAADRRMADEHHWAARSVWEALTPVLEMDESAFMPHVLTLPNVHHLATRISGRVKAAGGTVLDVVTRMHPTAAVGGTPTPDAVRVIAEVEPVDRGRYGAPVGWLDGRGDGEIALALRCGQAVRDAAAPAGEAADAAVGVRLHAGGGIVPGSDPAEEVTEIGVKFQPMRRALGVAEA
ncbi:isochorismate synthase [Micrococcus luteus]